MKELLKNKFVENPEDKKNIKIQNKNLQKAVMSIQPVLSSLLGILKFYGLILMSRIYWAARFY